MQKVGLVDEQVWSALQKRCEQWLRSRIHNFHDREDLVAECLARAWRRFSESCCCLREIWSWCLVSLRCLLVDRWRRARVAKSLPLPDGQVGPVEVSLEWALSTLRENASACDVPTLDLMLAGMASRDLAVCRGVTLRAVRSSQARLRALASQVGKDCW
jgi:DNA-directed RNA polymerase specialized sigma24 family protein